MAIGFRCDGTVDIECASWDRFAVAATYEPATGSHVHRSIEDLADWLLKRGGVWWAHCGGNYDFLALAEEFRRRSLPCTIDLSGSRISRVVSGKLSLRDSFPLIPLPLSTAAALAGEQAPDLGIRCTCDRSCGGYCTVRPGDLRRSVSDLATGDARVLYRVLQAFAEYAIDLGLELRGTLGSTAWATARKLLEIPDVDLTPAEWRAAKAGYYGGRVTICKPRATGPGSHWDISSAYPAALASIALPIGKVDSYGGRLADKCFARECPGIYTATIDVPELYLPPLPMRDPVTDRLSYPWGVLRGTWTLPEIQAAETRGAKVIAVHHALAWDAGAPIFGSLIRHWYAARRRVGKASPLGQLLRLLCNCITGKLAESPERRSVRMFPDELLTCPMTSPCSPRRCTTACGAYEQIDLWGQVWGVPFYRLAPSAYIHWAAYLTAATRVAWLTGAESQGRDLVYGDTDSVWSTARVGPRPQGKALGAWERKHSWSDWQCAAPRAYRYRDEDGGAIVRTAGMSITDDEWLAGGAETDRGVLPFMSAARESRGLFRRKAQRWTLPTRGYTTGVYGDRILAPNEGVTYPIRHG